MGGKPAKEMQKDMPLGSEHVRPRHRGGGTGFY
jgi:hypothetical protein